MLLVGKAEQVFDGPQQLPCCGIIHCESMLEAIELAGRETFDTIFVVVSCLDGAASSALGAMRQVSGSSHIILIAQMHEEFKARQLADTGLKSKKVADDYLICPLDIAKLIGQASLSADKSRTVRDDDKRQAQIRRLEAKIEQLQKLATEDDLTGLKNRRYVHEFLRQLLGRAKREELRVTLLVFDIDNFKHYNDTYGHSVGDNVLMQAGVMIVRCCREHDVVGRIGGDEFAVVFWDKAGEPLGKSSESKMAQLLSERRHANVEHPREAFFMAERFRREISSAHFSFLGTEGKGSLTISGGLVSFPQDGLTLEELFERADEAMLDAKHSGKNRIYLVGKP
jgi:diguanylate cyclase (GGDEF)-like protein